MSAPLVLRNSPVGKVVPAAGPLVIGLIFGFFAMKGLAIGAPGGRVALLIGLALACIALGLFLVRGAFNADVQVVLDEAGFRDLQVTDVLVPWAQVARVLSYSSHGDSAGLVVFELTGPLPEAYQNAAGNLLPSRCPTIRMEISSLYTTTREVVDAIRRLAPDVPIE